MNPFPLMKRHTLIYIAVVSLLAIPMLYVLRSGATLPPPGGFPASVSIAAAGAPNDSAFTAFGSALAQNFTDPLSRLFLQLLLIISCTRAVGWLFTRAGQPAVVGEMAAGILLGPSLFGLLAPTAFGFVFAAPSLAALKLLSQIGVCLFMFAVGMELNISQVKERAQTAIVVSHASIIIPYFLGVLLAWRLYSGYAAVGASFVGFALFLGISMSITAFPVLARILQERGLSRTALGSMALTCAAVDDVTAWTILAFVVAIVRASGVASSGLNLLLVLVFLAVMLRIIKPLLSRALRERAADESPSPTTLAIVVCTVMAAALMTEVIGIHALFGAFLAGAIMPETNGFRQKLGVRIENFSSVLLLPLFFAFTGLRTQIGLLNDAASWGVCLLIIAVATVGKLGGTAVVARCTGMNWSESLQLGALMNTRGLMELIALNIGYDLGILSPRIFTMLVIMALCTTMLTGPLLALFQRREAVFDVLPGARLS